MLAMPLPVAGDRQSLLEYLKYQHTAFLAVSHGLTDERARCTPTASTLCIGALIKHVTTMQYAWTKHVASGNLLPGDPRSLVGMMADLADQHTVHDDERLDGLLAAYRTQNAETLRVFTDADLDATIVVPTTSRPFTKILTGPRAGCSCTSSRSSRGMPDRPTSFASRSTGQRCTSYLPPWRAGSHVPRERP
jgi:uncharacterized damage-inducible protein DinB